MSSTKIMQLLLVIQMSNGFAATWDPRNATFLTMCNEYSDTSSDSISGNDVYEGQSEIFNDSVWYTFYSLISIWRAVPPRPPASEFTFRLSTLTSNVFLCLWCMYVLKSYHTTRDWIFINYCLTNQLWTLFLPTLYTYIGKLISLFKF